MMCCQWWTDFRTPSGLIVSIPSEQTALDLLALPEEKLTSQQKEVVAVLRVRRPSKGLGDTIAKVTEAVGIKPCGGCKKRQARLNKLVPYG